jgi:hypothetical protein
MTIRWLKAHLEFSFDPCQSHLKPQCSWDAWEAPDVSNYPIADLHLNHAMEEDSQDAFL